MTETLDHPTTPSWPLDARSSPRVHEAFENFSHAVLADGALPERTKELSAVAVAHITQCPYCSNGHPRRARHKGASPEEIMEGDLGTAEMRVGGADAHATLALRAMSAASSDETTP